MKKPILIIKNISREGPGLLKTVLDEHLLPYQIIDLSKNEDLPAVTGYSAVVVLGGPDSANDNTTKMRAERAFVKTVLTHKLPYLGICLGLQVLVKVAGGAVVRSSVKEVGFRDNDNMPFEVIMRTQTGEHDSLFAGLGESFRVFQLHGEMVTLTAKMEQLAIGRLIKNQVVKVGSNAYGIQCHFELTAAMFEHWLTEDPDLLKLDTTMLRLEFSAIQKTYTAVGRQLFENFIAVAGL